MHNYTNMRKEKRICKVCEKQIEVKVIVMGLKSSFYQIDSDEGVCFTDIKRNIGFSSHCWFCNTCWGEILKLDNLLEERWIVI